MSLHFITYGDSNFENARERLLKQAKSSGWFKTQKAYTPHLLTHEFKDNFKHIISQKRGGGYWIWKYDIIMQGLNEIDDNDILVYLDAGSTLNVNEKSSKRFNEYVDMIKNSDTPILVTQLRHLEIEYTKKEILDYFEISLNSSIVNTGQTQANFILMKKCDFVFNLFEIYKKALYSASYLFTDEFITRQYPRFKEPRHDQSVLSVILKKEGAIMLPDETYFKENGFWNTEKGKDFPIWLTRKK